MGNSNKKVNGNWGSFGDYEACSKTCGSGTQRRYRACNNPAPKHGGKGCPGVNFENRACNTNLCPVPITTQQSIITISTEKTTKKIITTRSSTKEFIVKDTVPAKPISSIAIILGVSISLLLLVIFLVTCMIVYRKKKNKKNSSQSAQPTNVDDNALPHITDSRSNENVYYSVTEEGCTSLIQTQTSKEYAELGEGGGRIGGNKNVIIESHYCEVKNEQEYDNIGQT